MDTLRVSASDLDAYRYFMTNEDATLDSLLARLRREVDPTPAMEAGTALHHALEHGEPGEHGEMSALGYTFTFQAEAAIDLPPVRECKTTGEYVVDGCAVTLVGKVDAIHGLRIDDHKLTGRYDAERFLMSYQWRAYLDLFGADEFRWNIFVGRPERDDPRRYVITEFHPLRMHRYPDMQEDLAAGLRSFVSFARQHMPERIMRGAA